MKIFKKISAIAASALMIGMTAGIAAAANYPAPFVVGNTADAAIVYGTGTGVSSLDVVQAGNIQSNLQSYMTGSTTTAASVSGEAYALFTGGTKIYVNDSLNTVTSVLTKSSLPTTLADGSFSGNVDASISQKIDLGSNPRVTFKRQPTSEDDPNYALQTSSTQANYIYNTTVTFSKAVNFSHADSEGNDITLFGMDFTISSSTDTDTIVLLKSAEKVSLSSDSPTADVTIAGATYTVELISASDSAATIQITDSAGSSESKEISEAASKKIKGVTVAVITADETNLKLSATVVVGSEKVTLEDGAQVKMGESDTSIDGTLVDFETGNPNNLTKLTISVYAPESDKDAIKAGESFADPVYGTFKVNFAGLNIPSDSTARETIKITPNSDDKMDVTFTDYRGKEKSFQWSKDIAGNVFGMAVEHGFGGAQLMSDDDNRNITVLEMSPIRSQGLVVVGNEDEGYLLKLTGVKNSSSTTSSNTDGDRVEFTDVFDSTATPFKALWVSDGIGDMIVGGKNYKVYLVGDSNNATEEYSVFLDYPDSTSNTTGENLILFPTIQTSKGAKVAFYEPTTIGLTNYGNVTPSNLSITGRTYQKNVSSIMIPDGDGYETAYIVPRVDNAMGVENFTISVDGATTAFYPNGTFAIGFNSVNWSVGGLTFAFTNTSRGQGGPYNETTVYLVEPDGVGFVNTSALIVWEEKDDNTLYHAQVILLEGGRTGDDGLGVDTSESGDTWSNVSASWRTSRASNSKITDAGDLWGAIITFDSGDSDQPTASISYPDEQVYTQLYMAAEEATITGGGVTAGTQLGEVLVKDSEVSNVDNKNLIVVGGSCINSVAANLVGGDYCGSAWTDATNVGSGEFLIQSFGDAYTTDKIALLVAGYEAADTVNAAKYLTTQTVDTTAEKKYKGTTSTSAELVTTEE